MGRNVWPSKELAIRDEKIKALNQQIEELGKTLSSYKLLKNQEVKNDRITAKLIKLEKALISARQRARQSEAQLHILEDKLIQMEQAKRIRPYCPTLEKLGLKNCTYQSVKSRVKVLYVGGRTGQLSHLHKTARQNRAVLLHHEGCIEDIWTRTDTKASDIDCVMCPLDCVSRSYCLKAKRLCIQENIPFMPLNTSSQSALKAALEQIHIQNA